MTFFRDFLSDQFNPKTPNSENVKYYSLAGSIEFPPYHMFSFPSRIISASEGPNDGLVSIKSAQWGNFLGIVELDHAEQIGWSFVVDPRPHFRKIVDFLAVEGH
eukprot:TRINITY_DN16234_c0_g1_i10.p1 TRINITY_DN16234_c0_g1~~TRINITY_DN16234_c0_g1_i10.p1  ORF type:complete len:104 (+),score=13.15 TRINITY_DN16234_c0_g1_i10:92-403(+)